MARLRLSLNEGSLLRRTALHVAAFVLGTAAFLALASFLLVTVLKGVMSPDKASSADDSGDDSATTATSAGPKPPRPPRKKRSAAPAAPAPPSADDE